MVIAKRYPCISVEIKTRCCYWGYTLYDLADKLRSRGWQVPAYSMPAHREDLVIQRILVRHGVSYDLGSLLIEDIKRSLAYFEKHPVSNPLSAEEAGGFNHG